MQKEIQLHLLQQVSLLNLIHLPQHPYTVNPQCHKIAALDPSDPFRRKHEDLMLEKLFDLGILGTGGSGKGKLSDVEHKVTVSAFARRRLPVVMTRLRMADTVQAATKIVEQGHVRVGTEVSPSSFQ